MHRRSLLALVPAALAGCAAFTGADPLKVFLVGIEGLKGEGLELRLAVTLRLQNPNEATVEFDGVALDLEVNGLELASGVSDQRGSVPRFGESVLTVPVTISALAMVRQAYAWSTGERRKLDYVAHGKLGGLGLGGLRFTARGEFEWPQSKPTATAP
jgi:LEA14-like dessication related protein